MIKFELIHAMTGTYQFWVILISLLAVVDRFGWRNGSVSLRDIEGPSYTDKFFRVGLTYLSNQRFIKSELNYTIRDTQDPTTVIAGKSRSLDFSKPGLNRGYLLIDKKLLSSGTWIVDLKVTTTGSRINPLHEIFPITTHIKRQVEIKL